MGGSIKTLLVVLAAIMSFVSVQTVRADDSTVTGKIVEAYRDLSTIVIEFKDDEREKNRVTIVGFPFHNLEAQLDEVWDPLDSAAEGITIEAGDCVTVEYSVKELCFGDEVNKWESLTAYCEECSTETGRCYEYQDSEDPDGEDPAGEDPDGLERVPRQINNNRPKP